MTTNNNNDILHTEAVELIMKNNIDMTEINKQKELLIQMQ